MFSHQMKDIALIFIFVLIAAASGFDLWADFSHGADIGHIFKEGVIVVVSLLVSTLIMLKLYKQQQEISALQQELENAKKPGKDPKKYVLEARKELASVITQQFSEWIFTHSEAEVGWLLLKGLTLKEIALLRNTQEKTVRQQASSIYKKSGVSGRHAFSAWFIEDIL